MSDNNNNGNKSKNKTHLNKAYRIDAGVNSRRYGDGTPIEIAAFVDSNDALVLRTIDQQTAGGGIVTPFNILCNAVGACAIENIIFDNNETIVLFADGDKVVVHRHQDDQDDRVAAVLWALGEKVFGEDVARQIKRAIKYRGHTRSELHEMKKKNAKRVVTTKDAEQSL